MPIGTLSTSQLISLLLIPLAVGMLIYLRRRSAPEPTQVKKAA
jgi:hypothetical protein